MDIVMKKEERALIVSLKGKMDAATAPELEKKITDLIADGEKCFVIDLQDLDYISSVGLRVFLVIAKKMKTLNGQVLISNLKGVVKEVFSISGFSSIMKIYGTKEEALKDI